MDEQRIFDTERVIPSYFKLALPIVFSMVITLIYNLADTYFIAQTNDTMLVAGVSVCGPLFTALMGIFIDDPGIIADGALIMRRMVLGMVFAAIVLLYTCVFQATGKPVQALIMSLSRQGLLFLAVFLAVTAIWKYDGFLIAQPLSDALSAALALIMYRMTFVKENR